EFGNLVFEALRPYAKRLGPAFGEIGAALEQFKSAERIFGAAAVHDLASLGARDRALEPRGNSVLAGVGFAQLGLKPGDVRFVTAQHLLDLLELGAQALGHVDRFLPLAQRRLG